MRSASYSDVRNRTFSLLRQPGGDNVNPQDETDFRAALAKNFRTAWLAYNWDFSMEIFAAEPDADGICPLNVRGDVADVYDADPRRRAHVRKINYRVGDGYFTVFGDHPDVVYVLYKKWEPSFDWDDYSESETYEDWDCAWKDGQLMIYSANDNAWAPIAIPYVFKEFLALSCAADMTAGSGRDDRSAAYRAMATDAIDYEIINCERTLRRAQCLNIQPYQSNGL